MAMDIKGAMKPEIFGITAMFLFVDFFDTAGSLFGLASRAGMLDKNGDLPRAQRAFTADAAATVFSAMIGVSPTTTFVESAAGIEEGGRTGKTAIVAGLCFLIAPIFWPLATGIPPHAPAAVLVLVGSMMTAQLTKIDWNDFRISIPAFLTTISIPMSFSIANGISLGVITYVAISVLSGHAKKINWVMYALGALLLSRYFLLPNMR
jgi:AGZA family xanthine/uracil permease-like MFS transporter